MRVLVTGGAGFIGSHLSERLLAAGHGVRVLDNLSSGKRANLPRHSGLEFIEGDVRNSADVEQVSPGIDAIIHLAAVASVQASIDDPRGTHQTNFVGTLNLLEAARSRGIKRFVYASSAAVYGDTTRLPVSEDLKPSPLSPYAADKLTGEYYLDFYSKKFGLACTAFRFFNIYGPRQDPSSPYSGVISIFVDRARAGSPVTVFGDGHQTRDFVFVADLVEILTHSLDNRAAGQVINVGRGIECSLLELLTELENIIGAPISRRHEAPRVGDIVRSCADVTRLQRVFGAVPRTTMAAGLARLVDFNKAHHA